MRFLMGKPQRLPFSSVTHAAGQFLPVTPFDNNLRVSLYSLLMGLIKGEADQRLRTARRWSLRALATTGVS